MEYNELAGRIREAFAEIADAEEKKMAAVLPFMVNAKMCALF